MDRFITTPSSEAIEKNYPESGEMQEDYEKYGDRFWCLYETNGEKPIRLVATDGGEPEDANFGRDFGWIVEELNHLALRFVAAITDVDQVHEKDWVVQQLLNPEFARGFLREQREQARQT